MGYPHCKVKATLVSTLRRQSWETRTLSTRPRFSIYGSPICVFSNTSIRTARGVDLSQFGPGWAGLTRSACGASELAGNELQAITLSVTGEQWYWFPAILDTKTCIGLSGNLTKILGRHQLKFGGFRPPRPDASSSRKWSTQARLRPMGPPQMSGAGGSAAVASALLGVRRTRHATSARNHGRLAGCTSTSYGFFVDDTFQATRKLTITAQASAGISRAYSRKQTGMTLCFCRSKPSPLGSILNPAPGRLSNSWATSLS